MKKIILIALITVTFSFVAHSQSKQESIKELIRLMQVDSVVERTVKSFLPAMTNQMKGIFRDSASQAAFSKSTFKGFAIMNDITKRLINEDMVSIYDKYYTETDILDFITFYKSPSGQKMITTQPEIQKDLMTVMFKKYMPAMLDSLKKLTNSHHEKLENQKQDSTKEQIYQVTEQMPEFPGGKEALSKFLDKNIIYPSAAKEAGISGRVYVQFIVRKNGRLTDVKLVRGIGGGCDEEAMRVIKKMPPWTAGKMSNQPVSVYFNLPVPFPLEKK